jgi:hypothetical protein
MVTKDFLVSYEAFCDPITTENCYVSSYYDESCDCEVIYEYKYIEKKANHYKEQMTLCGSDTQLDPMECEAVNFCADYEADCTVTYCDTTEDPSLCAR